MLGIMKVCTYDLTIEIVLLCAYVQYTQLRSVRVPAFVPKVESGERADVRKVKFLL